MFNKNHPTLYILVLHFLYFRFCAQIDASYQTQMAETYIISVVNSHFYVFLQLTLNRDHYTPCVEVPGIDELQSL